MSLQEKTKSFPKGPGVYLMKEGSGRIIYVGKASNLRSRVRQYFSGKDSRYQISFLMARVSDIDFLETKTAREALLLENSLIKKHKPRYNVFLKDDKMYQGLKLPVQEKFPRLLTTRKLKKDGSLYFGPFTSSDKLYQVKEFIDQYFQLRTCSDHEFQNRERPCLEYQIKRCSAPCVNYVNQEQYHAQIEQVRLFLEGKNKELKKQVQSKMNKAAETEEFEDAARYRDLLQAMDVILQNQNVTQLSFEFVDVIVFERRDKHMGVAVLMVRNAQLIDSKYYVFQSYEEDSDFLENFITQKYTADSFIPKQIFLGNDLENTDVIEQVLSERAERSVQVLSPKRGDKKKLVDLAFQNLNSHFSKEQQKSEEVSKALQELQDKLHLQNYPHRMECFDISNISGKDAVASMVVSVEGEAHKSDYKKFKIRITDEPNDFLMMTEVLSRRFKKSKAGWVLPDLLVVDGGKGQLSQAVQVLKDLNITGVDIVGIAKGQGQGARAKGLWDEKKEDDIYLVGRKNPVNFKRGSKALMLLQNLRDESHRFAITYHRKLREKRSQASVLDQIPGVGPKIKAALLKTFGSVEGLCQASVDEIQSVKGVSRTVAEMIKKLSPLP